MHSMHATAILRKMNKLLLCFCLLLLAFSPADGDKKLYRQAMKIHHKSVTVDSHTDTPLYFTRSGFDIGTLHNAREHGSKLDLPRMEAGGLDAVFFAVFVGQDERSEVGNKKAFKRASTLFDAISAEVKKNESKAEIALDAGDALRLKKMGKRAVFIGLENGYPIGNDLSLIQYFYDRGARYITLCHTDNNDICDSSTDSIEFNGLSSFGETVVIEMNRIGMMIDVSHISDSAFFDVIRLSKVPVIASHSSARAVCDHPRNLSDEMLIALAKNGGVAQVCLLSEYVKTMPPNPQRDSAQDALRVKYRNFKNLTDEESAMATNEWRAMNRQFPRQLATVADYADHIDHMVKVAGINHVGIGSDFDGGGGLEDCFDVSEFPNITVELLRRGYSEEDIKKIWGGNFFRVMDEVRKKAG